MTNHDHAEHRHSSHGHTHHEHDHRRSGRIAQMFRGLVGAHSHDASDSIDAALESDARGIRAVKVSFAALMVTAMVQLIVVAATRSVALGADTIHNFSDALTAVPLFFAFRLGRRAPDRRFTYGYRRAEDLAGLFVLVMIALSALVAGAESVVRLLHPRELENVGVLIVAGVAGFVGNELVALYRIREGNSIGSAALVADGHHARTDGFTSLAVVAGGFGAALGWNWADPVVGLAISVAIFVVLRGAARQIYYRLMDAVDPAIVDDISHQAAHVSGVRAVSATRVRWLGHRLSADLTIEVDPNASVTEGHSTASDVQQRVMERVRHVDDVRVHVHPATAAAL
ncbi:MAG TPA: cation diffusion facilitator family transporter [Mycobacterium sp.]|nr:cation diffusion facilitator family transporter [Mycobacterium sp.]